MDLDVFLDYEHRVEHSNHKRICEYYFIEKKSHIRMEIHINQMYTSGHKIYKIHYSIYSETVSNHIAVVLWYSLLSLTHC